MAYNSSDYRTRIDQMQSFGDVNGNEERKMLFKFKEPNDLMPIPTDQMKNEIEDFVKSCNCSTPIITDEGVVVTYKNQVALSDADAEKFNGRMPHETTVTLYMRDGKELKKTDDKGNLRFNQDKAKVVLYIYGTITK